MGSTPQIILDSCVLINLAASEEIADIVATIKGASLISTAAWKEALFLRDENDPANLIPLALDDLLATAPILVCDVTTDEEEEAFVRLANDLDDGEAMSIAIAVSRGMRFASDDQKACRVFRELVPDPDCLTGTSSILKNWAQRKSVKKSHLSVILRRIGAHARFTPSRRDPNFEWWQRAML